MKIAALGIVFGTVTLLLLTVGMVLLQIFLSRRENRWLGLILPGISLLLSLIGGVGQLAYVGQSGAELIGQLLMVFFLANIPTIIGLVIYAACRERFTRRREVEKMDLHDL